MAGDDDGAALEWRTSIIERLDRLARSLLIQEAILAELAKNGFALISVAEAELISDDPTRRAFQQMLGEFDKSQIA
jgi:DNA invertase Pin-like site-specific DNA recombinase